MPPPLNPEKALIFRITHIENVPWILENGCHCPNAECRDPGFVSIGLPDLIAKRAQKRVPIPPWGTLSDYVPFYFTPHSVMLFNISTGYNVPRRPMSDIAILVTSLPKLKRDGVPFVFSDQHAYSKAARFSSDLDDLDRINWRILQQRDFRRRNSDDLAKFDQYQAEALVRDCVPTSALLGIACHGRSQEKKIQGVLERLSMEMKVVVAPDWYF